MITLVVDFHSSTTYLQSQKFLALVTTLKYFFQSVRKILSGPCSGRCVRPLNRALESSQWEADNITNGKQRSET